MQQAERVSVSTGTHLQADVFLWRPEENHSLGEPDQRSTPRRSQRAAATDSDREGPLSDSDGEGPLSDSDQEGPLSDSDREAPLSDSDREGPLRASHYR